MNTAITKNYDRNSTGERLTLGHMYFERIQGKKKKNDPEMTKGLKHLFLPPEFLGHIVGEKSAMT